MKFSLCLLSLALLTSLVSASPVAAPDEIVSREEYGMLVDRQFGGDSCCSPY
ncbi:hypothetical protein SCP_0113060 [Sparassis crispa]|uniref:Uncharacterized protein n=1 Tax=Sparassis crispa TaxID=139825 RepID=A0A401G8E2_9APHY|nr:hypothetical protein SCP_0113060 [Sparassis crispa]GBE78418.1 hypothetical protein SCP_0113060 [Sparassis crispa]